ncbi:RNA-directed DNA polymerase (Reverse transcriptase), Ribonuclease H [Gossypium australe]|uniref:RNA-directed DNA polymerase (Reverse transcriptase), Ribonuclease H n=1 Tax=Gossypium australe TaxID=47621 RepID=A0A5B6UY33_9ROSI|nr:RNA-directed DNA polymerase (Reverse transcriptase), Ribonuclease H [Gossypium australe]
MRPIFRLLKKHNSGVRDEECQKNFGIVKHYLSNAPILMPPSLDKPLILYLTIFGNSMGWVLGQHDESGKKERAIYYLDPLKYMMESTALNERMARWQILLSEFDIIYVNQKAVNESSITDFLASRALEDCEPLNFDFPNEDLIYVVTTEERVQEKNP